jgi:RNA 3'-terminal phosphate cyclase (ATP)
LQLLAKPQEEKDKNNNRRRDVGFESTTMFLGWCGMIHIDGAQGEGGGQILRSSLTLSILTGKPVSLTNIRARRPRPGLMAQHLNAVLAAAAVSMARVEGARLHSLSLVFAAAKLGSGKFPVRYRHRRVHFAAAPDHLAPAQLRTRSSQVVITGGTHVLLESMFHYLREHWLKAISGKWFDFDLEMDLAGFIPRWRQDLRANPPVADLKPL